MNPSRRRRHDAPEGFTLIEIVVVLFILGVVISMAAVLTRGVSAAQKRSITTTRLAAVDAALVQFVQQQRRLPCPAGGKRVSTDTAGPPYPGDEINQDAVLGCTNETDGVVPWRTLGLSETDATDGWGRRITYRVDPKLGANRGMDMSWCDPAGTEGVAPNPALAAPRACNVNCTSTALQNCTLPTDFLTGKGLLVLNLGGANVMNPGATPNTGAAYVLISAGESGGGAYLNSGSISASTRNDSTNEKKNYASANYSLNTKFPPLAPDGTYYIDDVINDDDTGDSHFDDIVMRPSVMNVISRAGLGPRSH